MEVEQARPARESGDSLSATLRREPAQPWVPSIRIVSVYVVVSLLWITLSDRVLHGLTTDPETLAVVQTVKGWLFVGATALMLFLIIQRTIASLQALTRAESDSAGLLAGIFESSAFGIAVEDASGHYVKVNPAFGKFLGLPADQIVGRHFSEFTFPEDLPKAEATLGKLLAEPDRVHVLEKRFVRADGTLRWALISGTTLLRPDGIVTVAVVKDITERLAREAELRRTLQELRDVDAQRRALLTDLLKAEESEQERIASDIHDDAMQLMTSAAMTLDLLEDEIKDPAHVDLVGRAADLIRTSISRLRKMVFELKPPELDSQGLPAVLERLLEETFAGASVSFELRAPAYLDMGAEVRLLLYKVAREALHNARKHAEATHIVVDLEQADDGIRMVIRDNGVGFDVPSGTNRRQHFGLRQMVDRVKAARGTFVVHSAPGAGVSLECWVPRTLGAQDRDEAA